MGNHLLNDITSTFFSGNLKDDVMRFLSETNSINGTTGSEKWACFLSAIANWQSEYQVKSDTMALYGYITWTLDISVYQFLCTKSSQLKQLLLKALLISHFYDTEHMSFKDQTDIDKRLDIELFELLELNSCSEITKKDLIVDLKRFYDGSTARLQNHKVKYAKNAVLNQKLEMADEKFRAYIKWLEQCYGDGQIVRINQLGVCENGSNYPTEISLYFLLSEQTLHLLVFSDFA